MRKYKSSLWSLYATLCLLFCAGANQVDAQQLVPSMEYPIIGWTNMARQYYGRGRVMPNPRLTLAAQRHALNMAAQEHMSHTLDGATMAERVKLTGYPYASVGENVAYNFGYPNPDWKLFEGWMNSPGHFQNIVNGEFTEIGVGVARSATGKFYACQVFGRPVSMTAPYAYPYQGYGYRPLAGWTAPPPEPSFYYLSDAFPEWK